MSENLCDIGKHCNSLCHLEHYTKKKTLHDLSSVSENELKLLKYRTSNFDWDTTNKICDHHKLFFLVHFNSIYSKKCCDPFSAHSKPIKSALKDLTVSLCDKFTVISPAGGLIPGKKVCANCYIKILDQLSDSNIENKNEQPSENSTQSDNIADAPFTLGSQSSKRISGVLNILGLPPLCTEKLTESRKQKLLLQTKALIFTKITQDFFDLFNLSIDANVDYIELLQSNESFIQILQNIKIKFNQAQSIKQKCEILSLLPENWSLSKTQQHLDCTRYMYDQVKKIRTQKGKFLK